MKKKNVGILAIAVCLVVAVAVFAAAKSSDANKKADAVPIKKLSINKPAPKAQQAQPGSVYDQIMQDQRRMMRKMRQMDRAFNDPFFNRPMNMRQGAFGMDMNSPSTRFNENPNEYVLQVITPGMDKKDLSIEMQGKVLTIKGAEKTKKNEKGKKTRGYEQFSTQFTQSFTIPRNADVKKISSEYKNGILTVTIPKDKTKTSSKTVNIPIK